MQGHFELPVLHVSKSFEERSITFLSQSWMGFPSLVFYPLLQLLSSCPNNSEQQSGGPVYLPCWKKAQDEFSYLSPVLLHLCPSDFARYTVIQKVVSVAKNTPRSIYINILIWLRSFWVEIDFFTVNSAHLHYNEI